MKKQTLKNLALRKRTISKLAGANRIKGGITPTTIINSTICKYNTAPNTEGVTCAGEPVRTTIV